MLFLLFVCFISAAFAQTSERDIKCEYKGEKYGVGQSWMVDNFRFQCLTTEGGWKADIIACKWNRTGEELQVGETMTFQKWTAKCYRDGNTVRWEERELTTGGGGGLLLQGSGKVSCKHEGQSRPAGTEWDSGNFRLKCLDTGNGGWKVDIIACKSPSRGLVLKVGESKTTGNYSASCYREGSQVRFEEREGFTGVRILIPGTTLYLSENEAVGSCLTQGATFDISIQESENVKQQIAAALGIDISLIKYCRVISTTRFIFVCEKKYLDQYNGLIGSGGAAVKTLAGGEARVSSLQISSGLSEELKTTLLGFQQAGFGVFELGGDMAIGVCQIDDNQFQLTREESQNLRQQIAKYLGISVELIRYCRVVARNRFIFICDRQYVQRYQNDIQANKVIIKTLGNHEVKVSDIGIFTEITDDHRNLIKVVEQGTSGGGFHQGGFGVFELGGDMAIGVCQIDDNQFQLTGEESQNLRQQIAKYLGISVDLIRYCRVVARNRFIFICDRQYVQRYQNDIQANKVIIKTLGNHEVKVSDIGIFTEITDDHRSLIKGAEQGLSGGGGQQTEYGLLHLSSDDAIGTCRINGFKLRIDNKESESIRTQLAQYLGIPVDAIKYCRVITSNRFIFVCKREYMERFERHVTEGRVLLRTLGNDDVRASGISVLTEITDEHTGLIKQADDVELAGLKLRGNEAFGTCELATYSLAVNKEEADNIREQIASYLEIPIYRIRYVIIVGRNKFIFVCDKEYVDNFQEILRKDTVTLTMLDGTTPKIGNLRVDTSITDEQREEIKKAQEGKYEEYACDGNKCRLCVGPTGCGTSDPDMKFYPTLKQCQDDCLKPTPVEQSYTCRAGQCVTCPANICPQDTTAYRTLDECSVDCKIEETTTTTAAPTTTTTLPPTTTTTTEATTTTTTTTTAAPTTTTTTATVTERAPDTFFCDSELESCRLCTPERCTEDVIRFPSEAQCTSVCESKTDGTGDGQGGGNAAVVKNGETERTDETLTTDCVLKGKILSVGQNMTAGRFQFQCSSPKQLTVSGCIIEDGALLEVGRVIVRNGSLHQCIQYHGQVFYRTETFIAESSQETLRHILPAIQQTAECIMSMGTSSQP